MQFVIELSAQKDTLDPASLALSVKERKYVLTTHTGAENDKNFKDSIDVLKEEFVISNFEFWICNAQEQK